MSGSQLRPEVLAARRRLAAGRAEVRHRHERGVAGRGICDALTDLIDGVVGDLFEAALESLGRDRIAPHVALVAHGGYGRRDVAPFSDVDLMLLCRRDAEAAVRPLAGRLTQDICDAGLTLGFSLRSVPVACSLALRDVVILTSLAESRCVAGNRSLFSEFAVRLQRAAGRAAGTLIPAIEQARLEERMRYGATAYLLTPNIKRSRGGLRDIQLVRWIGFVRYGQTDPAQLQRIGAVTPEDRQRLDRAHEYLLRLRHELHFRAGKAHDVLDRLEQIQLAQRYGYADRSGLMAVEQFMRDYFAHTGEVRYASAHFVASARSRGVISAVLNRMASHNVQRDFRVGPLHIGATARGLDKVRRDVAQVLRLMDLANLYNKRIDHGTWQAIRETMAHRGAIAINREIIDRFLSLMSQPPRLSDLLRRLHELRVLEKIVPGLDHARCLMQFNEYHKYTIDEHCLRAVEEATRFLEDEGPLGRAYRGLKNKRILHLALLLHDLGKGYAEDHSLVGARLAEQTARRLMLAPRDAHALRFLVHRHLLMSRLARLRDINDPDVVTELAVEVGAPEMLQMLYVMTCADLAAVGPGVLTQWKRDLLTQLYRSARRQLTGDFSSDAAPEPRIERRILWQQAVGDRADDPWWRRQIDALCDALGDEPPSRRLIDRLQRLKSLPRADVVAWARYLPETQAVEFTVGAHEDIVPGIFHRLTGALTSQRLEILSAQISTLADGLVLDRFYVQDNDFEGPPPEDRMDDVCSGLIAALKQPSDQPPAFPQIWGDSRGTGSDDLPRPPAQVRVDNNTCETSTILDVFASDRMGLLYTIARKIFELGLSVHFAKIGSHLDQVVDVFYVTDRDGHKIHDERRLEGVRTALLEKIAAFEDAGSTDLRT